MNKEIIAQAKEILGGLCISGMMFGMTIFFWCCI